MTTESQTSLLRTNLIAADQTLANQAPKLESLTKAEILSALSKRLGCSEENLGFLFEPPSLNLDSETELMIPEIRVGQGRRAA